MIARRLDATWSVAPAPGSAALNGIFAFSDDDVWAVGADGAIVHFDGASLEAVASPTSHTLHGIWGSAPDDIWAVGESGTIIHWDGQIWTSVSGAYDELHAVWGSGPDDVYAVGGTLNVGTIAHFDGASWTASSSGLSGAGFYAVSGNGAGDVYAAGQYGHLYRASPGPTMHWVADVTGGATVRGLLTTGSEEIWAVSDSSLVRWDGNSAFELAPAGGNALAADPATSRLLIAGQGLASFADGTLESLIAPGWIAQLWMNDDVAIAVTTDGDVVHREGGPWSTIPGVQGSLYGLDVHGLKDGTRIVIDRSSSPWRVYGFDGTSLSPLPPLDEERLHLPVVFGQNEDDFWIVNATAPTRYQGSWQLGSWPAPLGSNLGFDVQAALADSASEIWVVGAAIASTGPDLAAVAHFDGTSWSFSTAGEPATIFESVARFGGKLYAAGGRTDYTKPKPGDFVHYPHEPVLYEYSGSSWTKLTLPNVTPQYGGTLAGFVAASASELYFVLGAPHPGAPNLMVYDGKSFSERPYPATAAQAAFVGSDGTLRLLAGNGPGYGILRSR